MIAAAVAFAQPAIVPPIRELDHPRYTDAVGQPVSWGEVQELAQGSGASAQVARRRLGRTLVRAMFASATALEIWGASRLLQSDRPNDRRIYGPILATQAGFTGLCAVLSITGAPGAIREDRAIWLDAANARPAP